MEENVNRAEAERLLAIAEKLLQDRDLNASKDFAIIAQETEPLLEASDQILAIVDVLLAAEKGINHHHLDWYAILQIGHRSDDGDLIRKQYRRLALLLHPDKNKFAFADVAFKLVADAWALLSDAAKKSIYDDECRMFSKVDPPAMKNQREFQFQFQQNQADPQFQHKLPVRRSAGGTTPCFWTACPYCYNLYEYPRVYEGCCLRCQNCERAFHGAAIPYLPPLAQGGKVDEYHCCWGFFPMGFAEANSEAGKSAGFPNWMPSMFPTAAASGAANGASPMQGGDRFVGGNVRPSQTGKMTPRKDLHV